jgi:hypothetical protein
VSIRDARISEPQIIEFIDIVLSDTAMLASCCCDKQFMAMRKEINLGLRKLLATVPAAL